MCLSSSFSGTIPEDTIVSAETVAVDRYVVDTLLRDFVGHDHSPSSFLVYLHLATRRVTGRSRRVTASYADLAHYTGLSKSAVQSAVRNLKRRRFVRVERATPTATPVYEVLSPWRR
jgi:DNA-binding MarR family transcriptional regulator